MLTPETPSLTSGDGDEPLLLVVAPVVRRSYLTGSHPPTNETGGIPITLYESESDRSERGKKRRIVYGVVYCALFLPSASRSVFDHDVSYDPPNSLELVFINRLLRSNCYDHDNDNAFINA